MARLEFKVQGLDCAEEIAILKRAVGPVVGGPDRLDFDVLSGVMSVEDEAGAGLADRVIEAVRGTGMRAVPFDSAAPSAAEPDAQTLWQRRRRAALTSISGFAIAAGYLLHARIERSFLAPLIHGGDAAHVDYPPLTVACYVLATLAGVWFVLPKAWHSIRRFSPDMNLLMTVAIAGAWVVHEWLEAATVAFLFAASISIEAWSVARARRAIHALIDISPPMARVVGCCAGDGGEPGVEERPVEEVQPGARVRVRPGERIPLDGKIVKGRTSIDQAPITGESIPVERGPGDEIFAGTINKDAAIEFEVTRPAGETTLAHLIRLVHRAQANRAPAERWIETFARRYTPVMMGLALLIAVVPPLLAGGEWGRWFYQSMVILVIACPCALVISTPVSIVAGLTSAAREGVLIKGGAFLEMPSRIKVFAFDKTGTLTLGKPEIQEVVALSGHTEEEVLARAAALESHSLHPLASTIVRHAEERDVEVRPAEDFNVVEGLGAEGTIDGRRFWVGGHRYVHHIDAEHEGFHELAVQKEDQGHSLVIVGNERHICGMFSIADAVRERAAATVGRLKALGMRRVVMLTGDNPRTAAMIAATAGVDEFYAELMPEEKVERVRALRAEYGPVAMVGDGINDAPALAAADIGIAMGVAGADAAIETADIALMSDDLEKLPWLVSHSRRTLAIIKQNVAFAVGLKILFITLAFAELATLWMAIAADTGATLIVIANGLRLLRPTKI